MPRRRSRDDDALKFFFEDVSRLPIAGGRRDYLPLTRRVQRWRTLKRLAQPTPEATHHRIARHFVYLLQAFNAESVYHGAPPIDVRALGSEIEGWLDDPEHAFPAEIQRVLGMRIHHKVADNEARLAATAGLIYTLALLPPALRVPGVKQQFTPEVKAHLLNVYSEGKAAKTRLVEGTLRFVIQIARSYVQQDVPYSDLVQEGVIGLMRAVDRYDEHQSHFQTYAANWIKQKITRFIADHSHVIRYPVHFVEEIRAWGKAYDQQAEANGGTVNVYEFMLERGWLDQPHVDALHAPLPSPPATHDLADAARYESEWTTWKAARIAARHAYRKALARYEPFIVRHRPVYRVSFAGLAPYLMDDHSFEADYAQIVDMRSVFDNLKSLGDRDRQVILLRFGFADGESWTLEAIATRFGVTRERIRQIEVRVFKELRRMRTKRLLPDSGLDSDLAHIPSTASNRLRTLGARLAVQDHYFDYLEPSGEWQGARIDQLIQRYIVTGRKGVRRERMRQDAAETIMVDESGLRILPDCPVPLLPRSPDATAFLESIAIGQDALSSSPMTAAQFWTTMRGWANNEVPVQGAFDTWYVAGLIDYIDFASSEHAQLQCALPPGLSLNALRQHCAISVSQRIAHMPALLGAIERLAEPTVARLAATVSGAARDLARRLSLLASMSAVKSVGGMWWLTPIGRAALEAVSNELHSDDDDALIIESNPLDDLDLLDV